MYKVVIRLTDVYCNKKACLNNAKGWCKAKVIHIDGMCRSYVAPHTLIKGKHARVEKRQGRYRNSPSIIK